MKLVKVEAETIEDAIDFVNKSKINYMRLVSITPSTIRYPTWIVIYWEEGDGGR